MMGAARASFDVLIYVVCPFGSALLTSGVDKELADVGAGLDDLKMTVFVRYQTVEFAHWQL